MKTTNLRPALPAVLVSGKSVLRAATRDVRFDALPPAQVKPPARGPEKPKREARVRAVCFSMMVRAGETW